MLFSPTNSCDNSSDVSIGGKASFAPLRTANFPEICKVPYNKSFTFVMIRFAPTVSTAVLGLSLLAYPAAAIEVHHSPVENLEHVDAALIATAERTIDVAAFVLSDHPVITALNDASARGVEVRIVLDRSQLPHSFVDRIAGPEVRVSPAGPLMHLKSYAVDGRTLRTGSANFTASGLKHQANDLIVIKEPDAVARFGAVFEREWNRATPIEARR